MFSGPNGLQAVCFLTEIFLNRSSVVFMFSLNQILRTPLACMSTFLSDLSSRDTLDCPRCGLARENSMTTSSMALSVRFL